MTNRDRLLMMTASGIVRDIRPECMNAAEILGRVTEALATRDAEIERLRAVIEDAIDAYAKSLGKSRESLVIQNHEPSWRAWKSLCDTIAALNHQQPSGSRCMLCGAITETTCTPAHPALGCQQSQNKE